MLTLWARLLLCDLFIHGIGGAQYDRVTDLIVENYFGVTAAEHGLRFGDAASTDRRCAV